MYNLRMQVATGFNPVPIERYNNNFIYDSFEIYTHV